MDIAAFLRALRARPKLIALTTLVGAVLGLVFGSQSEIRYAASAIVIVAPNGADTQIGSVAPVSSQEFDQLITTKVRLITSAPVIDKAAGQLRVDPKALAGAITAERTGSTRLVKISAQGPDGKSAVARANVVATSFVQVEQANAQQVTADKIAALDAQLVNVRKQLSDLSNQLEASTSPAQRASLDVERTSVGTLLGTLQSSRDELRVDAALAQTRAQSQIAEAARDGVADSGPGRSLLFVGGGLLGAVLGLLIALVAEQTGGTLRTRVAIEQSLPGLTVFGVVPVRNPMRQLPIKTKLARQPFVQVANQVLATTQSNRTRRVVVTSIEPGTGKTTVSARLAAHITESGRYVLAVDAGTRMPSLPEALGVERQQPPAQPGALPALISPLRDVPGSTRLKVLLAPEGDRRLAWSTDAVRTFLNSIDEQAVTIVVDAPSMSESTHAVSLASGADVVVLVVGPRTGADRIREAYNLLERLPGVSVGIVLNRSLDK